MLFLYLFFPFPSLNLLSLLLPLPPLFPPSQFYQPASDDTHKFESQYLFKLVGGTPAQVPQIYHDRSPVYNAGNITASLLLLQGLDDKVRLLLFPPPHSLLCRLQMLTLLGMYRYV
jgi:hypothetical protein